MLRFALQSFLLYSVCAMVVFFFFLVFCFFFQAEDGIRDRSPSRGLGDVYKRQIIWLFHQKSDISDVPNQISVSSGNQISSTINMEEDLEWYDTLDEACLLYTSPSPRDGLLSRMPSSA